MENQSRRKMFCVVEEHSNIKSQYWDMYETKHQSHVPVSCFGEVIPFTDLSTEKDF